MLSIGFGLSITIYAFINIGVVIGVIPVTGVPLPFISYGGSSLIINLMMIAILLNISRAKESLMLRSEIKSKCLKLIFYCVVVEQEDITIRLWLLRKNLIQSLILIFFHWGKKGIESSKINSENMAYKLIKFQV